MSWGWKLLRSTPFQLCRCFKFPKTSRKSNPWFLLGGPLPKQNERQDNQFKDLTTPSAQVSKTSHPKGCIPRGEGRGKISSVEVSCIALPTEPWTEGSNRNMCGPNPNKSLATSDPNPLSLCASLHKLPRCKDAPWRRKDLDSERWNPCVPFWEFEPSLLEPGGSQFPGGGLSALCMSHAVPTRALLPPSCSVAGLLSCLLSLSCPNSFPFLCLLSLGEKGAQKASFLFLSIDLPTWFLGKTLTLLSWPLPERRALGSPWEEVLAEQPNPQLSLAESTPMPSVALLTNRLAAKSFLEEASPFPMTKLPFREEVVDCHRVAARSGDNIFASPHKLIPLPLHPGPGDCSPPCNSNGLDTPAAFSPPGAPGDLSFDPLRWMSSLLLTLSWRRPCASDSCEFWLGGGKMGRGESVQVSILTSVPSPWPAVSWTFSFLLAPVDLRLGMGDLLLLQNFGRGRSRTALLSGGDRGSRPQLLVGLEVERSSSRPKALSRSPHSYSPPADNPNQSPLPSLILSPPWFQDKLCPPGSWAAIDAGLPRWSLAPEHQSNGHMRPPPGLSRECWPRLSRSRRPALRASGILEAMFLGEFWLISFHEELVSGASWRLCLEVCGEVFGLADGLERGLGAAFGALRIPGRAAAGLLRGISPRLTGLFLGSCRPVLKNFYGGVVCGICCARFRRCCWGAV